MTWEWLWRPEAHRQLKRNDSVICCINTKFWLYSRQTVHIRKKHVSSRYPSLFFLHHSSFSVCAQLHPDYHIPACLRHMCIESLTQLWFMAFENVKAASIEPNILIFGHTCSLLVQNHHLPRLAICWWWRSHSDASSGCKRRASLVFWAAVLGGSIGGWSPAHRRRGLNRGCRYMAPSSGSIVNKSSADLHISVFIR